MRGGTRRSRRSTSCRRSTTRSTSCSSDDDLKRDVFRSGGPGGQHQNKTESGVRYTHLPTGIAAESRSERSQHKNDANALALLKAKLIRLEEEKREAEFAKKYDEKGEVSFGNQIRSYVLQPYQIVKDSADRLRGRQPPRGPRRRDRRLHRVVPADEALGSGDREGLSSSDVRRDRSGIPRRSSR